MRSLLLLIFCLSFTTVQAQKMSWRKHAKLAEKQKKEGNFVEAAENYEAAWNKKKKKKKYIFQAAECYYEIKNYRKAAECYEHIKEENDDFMLAGLKYCRSLKMDGQYDEASRALVYFVNGYNEKDKDLVAKIVQDEIRGCELAMSLMEKKSNNISIERLSDKVNSDGGDFAPIPFSDDVLYYTSNMVGETKMYLTQKSNGVWGRSKVPKNFPRIAAAHFGNGAFSPDNRTFFYTQCDHIDAIGRMFNGCEIFVTQRSESGWSKPVKLNNNVNRTGSTTNHPFIVHEDNEEILYFSSNRNGGQGGMDIWKSTRPIGSKKLNFSKPVNLGKNINSIADEITPYFDEETNTLYFSSNGGINLGGFDVYQAEKENALSWGKPKNMGFPFNSSADDYSFIKFSPEGGYIVSNRKFGLEKTDFSNDDIYSFSVPTERMMAMGSVMNESTSEVVSDVSVSLYEITPEGNVRLLENKTFESGTYEFGLLPNKNYRIEAMMDGLSANGVEFNTVDNDQMKFENNLMLKEMTSTLTDTGFSDVGIDVPTSSTEMTTSSTSTTSTTSSSTSPAISSSSTNGNFSNPQPTQGMTSSEGYTSGSTSSSSSTTMIETTPTNTVTVMDQSVVYKIQLMAVRKYRDNDPRLRQLRNYGNIETEFLPNKNLTRVFLTSYQTKSEAEEILQMMKGTNRSFKTAIVVRYENGVRIDPWQK